MKRFKLSMGSWAYLFNQAEPTNDFLVVLQKLQKLGYPAVELGSFGPHPSPVSHATHASRQKLKAQIKDHGMALSGIAVDLWSFKTPGVSILEETPSAYLTAFLGWCRFASDVGAQTIRVDTVLAPDFFGTLDGQKIGYKFGVDRIIAVWDKASKMAADFGLNVCWEFEPGFVLNKPSEIVHVVDGVRVKNNPNFGALFDSCHAHMCAVVGANHQGEKELLAGGVMELLGMLSGKITHIHVIDSDGTLNEHNTSTHNPFGAGVLDFDQLLPALAQCGCPHDWLTVDLCFWPNAWDVTAQSLAFLQKKLAA